jgi:hypothetical protein
MIPSKEQRAEWRKRAIFGRLRSRDSLRVVELLDAVDELEADLATMRKLAEAQTQALKEIREQKANH